MSSSSCLHFTAFNSVMIEQSRVESHLVSCLRIWRHTSRKYRRKSMPWSVILHYRWIEARGKGLSTVQSFLYFRDSDCKHSCNFSECSEVKVTLYGIGNVCFFLQNFRGDLNFSLYVMRNSGHCGNVSEAFNVPCVAMMWNTKSFFRSFFPDWQLYFRLFSP